MITLADIEKARSRLGDAIFCSPCVRQTMWIWKRRKWKSRWRSEERNM